MESKKQRGKCTVCGSFFSYYATEQSGRYCSRKCSSTVLVKNLGTRMLGKHWTSEQREKFRAANSGPKHHRWAGDNVNYNALHLWVERNKGKPTRCEICGTTDPIVNYEWANRSHEYHRDLDDFFGLCKPCHAEYDKKPVTQVQLDHLASIREATKAWHASPEGRAWHKEHARKIWLDPKMHERTCEECGKIFSSVKSTARCCSRNCIQRNWVGRHRASHNAYQRRKYRERKGAGVKYPQHKK